MLPPETIRSLSYRSSNGSINPNYNIPSFHRKSAKLFRIIMNGNRFSLKYTPVRSCTNVSGKRKAQKNSTPGGKRINTYGSLKLKQVAYLQGSGPPTKEGIRGTAEEDFVVGGNKKEGARVKVDKNSEEKVDR